MNHLTTLHPIDYAILAIVMIISLGIGVYFAYFTKKPKTTAEYFIGSNKMSVIPIFLSMLATFITSTMLIGIPAEVYYYGFDFCYSTLGTLIGGPFAIYGMLPVFSNLRITSMFEYVEHRFNRQLRVCTSLMNIVTMVLVTSFAIYAPAIALSQTTGVNEWTSILTTTIIGTIYSSIGGIKAIVWSDVLQLAIFSFAVVVTIINGLIDVGGGSYIIRKSIEGGRLGAPSFSVDPRIRLTIWGLLSYSSIRGIMLCISQAQLQRYMCCKNTQMGRRSVWCNIIFTIPMTLVYCFVGLILYAKYWNCDPLSSQQIQRPDQIYPLFVMQTLNNIPGMAGLFIAALYSAGLSSMSSQLNSLAAVTLEDHVKPRWKTISDEKATLISKCLVLIFGGLCLMMIIIIMNLGNMIAAMYYLIGGTFGSILGIFTIGLMNPWANSKGTSLGIICSLGVCWWITIGNQIYRPSPMYKLPVSTVNCSNFLGNWTLRPEPTTNFDDVSNIYKISYLWITPIAFSISILIGSLCSLVIGSNKNFELKLLSPFVHSIMKKHFPKKYAELKNNHKPSELNNEQEIMMINKEEIIKNII